MSRLLLHDREVDVADRLVDQALVVCVLEDLAGHLRRCDERQLGHLSADLLQRALRLGLDLPLRLLEATLAIGLRLFLDTARHRFRDLAGLGEDLLGLAAGLADEGAVLFEQSPRFFPRLLCLFDRAADALAPLVDDRLDPAEGDPLEEIERRRETDDRPDHQPEPDLDQWIRGDQHQTRTYARIEPRRP